MWFFYMLSTIGIFTNHHIVSQPHWQQIRNYNFHNGPLSHNLNIEPRCILLQKTHTYYNLPIWNQKINNNNFKSNKYLNVIFSLYVKWYYYFLLTITLCPIRIGNKSGITIFTIVLCVTIWTSSYVTNY